jgi:hypothetical protein
MAPGGVNARFSPDGQNLLYTTICPSSIYTATNSGALALDPIPNIGTVYLQLMNIKDHKETISIPAMTLDEFHNLERADFNFARFSPDGRYLAFQSLGSVGVDEKVG